MSENKVEDIAKSVLDFDKRDIADALEVMGETPTPGQLDIDELKRAGLVIDISEVNMSDMVKQLSGSVSLQRTLNDVSRGSTDNTSIKDYIEKQIVFLTRISNKTQKEAVETLDMAQVKAYLKITAKMGDAEISEPLIKKHLKNIKKKYS